MPELPDISVYLEALEPRVLGRKLLATELLSPFFLRTAVPPIEVAAGLRVRGLKRLGKRIAIGLAQDYWLVMHLMIAGRLVWSDAGGAQAKPTRNTLARFEFDSGVLSVTEAGTKKRAALHFVKGQTALAAHDPGGLEVLDARFEQFQERITRENRTLKRALTDPRILSGIGNAYSDEILHRAKLSPVTLTSRLEPEQIRQLFDATREVLLLWLAALRVQCGDGFPRKVTAFREGMAVHGRYRQPCPVCATAVQRIRYASNETNYCPRCQTGGRVLADRALSRLLKKDWPRTIEELERLGH